MKRGIDTGPCQSLFCAFRVCKDMPEGLSPGWHDNDCSRLALCSMPG